MPIFTYPADFKPSELRKTRSLILNYNIEYIKFHYDEDLIFEIVQDLKLPQSKVRRVLDEADKYMNYNELEVLEITNDEGDIQITEQWNGLPEPVNCLSAAAYRELFNGYLPA